MKNKSNLKKEEYLELSPYFIDEWNFNKTEWDLFQDKIEATPEKIVDFIMAPETAEEVKLISLNFNLSKEQAQGISRTIRDFSVGDIQISKIATVIKNKTGIIEDDAIKIKEIILSRIPLDVIGELKKIRKEEFNDFEKNDNDQNLNTLNLRKDTL